MHKTYLHTYRLSCIKVDTHRPDTDLKLDHLARCYLLFNIVGMEGELLVDRLLGKEPAMTSAQSADASNMQICALSVLLGNFLDALDACWNCREGKAEVHEEFAIYIALAQYDKHIEIVVSRARHVKNSFWKTDKACLGLESVSEVGNRLCVFGVVRDDLGSGSRLLSNA